MTPAQRYLTDPIFHSLVNIFRAEIARAQVTPTEIREAALLAQILFEQELTRKIPIYPEESWLHKEPEEEPPRYFNPIDRPLK
jgi:hypothetical protein